MLQAGVERRVEEVGPSYEGIAEFYDYFSTQDDLPFYLHYAKKQGSPILDIGAGTGRVSRHLAKHGFRVTALENSPSMISHLEQRLKQLDSAVRTRVSVVRADMRDFEIGEEFKLIVIPASFGHAMTTEDQLSTLESIHHHLAPDGLFILDLYPAGTMDERSRFEEHPVELPDGRTVKREGVIDCDPVQQVMRVDLTYKIRHSENKTDSWDEEIEIVSGAALIYNREADLLVRLAGFYKIEEFGSFEGEPYEPSSPRRIMLLKRK
ncbi:class I SAM-dependent methyltransferase [Candidatus Thorarchaeota archaeon]|nr:MAG: class I SAM-dependent methyltransferase [Candidatus Thorarchaeota archaeon]